MKEEYKLITTYFREKAANLPHPVCDICGAPESKLSFYLKWWDDPMAVMHFCDEHALKKRRQDRLYILVPPVFIIGMAILFFV